MPRPPKRGIEFAGWDTAIFENDTKIDKLIDAQGGTGFYVYFWLCQKAYASDGYFYRWSYADSATTARKMAGCIRSETVKAAVGTCCQVGLFEKRLLEREGILTSRGIQRRYIRAIEKRAYRAVDKRYWLLDELETAAGKIVFLNDCQDVGDSYAFNHGFLPDNAGSLPENKPYIVEYSRVENIESVRAREDADFERFFAAYPNKYNPGEAYKAFLAVADERPPIDVLIDAIERQKQSQQWQEAGGKYIQAPARWLRSKGWLNQEPEADERIDNGRTFNKRDSGNTQQSSKRTYHVKYDNEFD